VVLWRISRHQDLRGIGGLRAGGRWHYSGQPVVYLAENPASALLEVCVHTAANDVPPDFTLLRIEGPELSVGSIAESVLPQDWQTRLDVTRDLGTDWLRSSAGCLLRIPSAIVPQTSNFLFNPVHPDARLFRIAEILSYPFDGRIKR
jgi:RES domain-containing protein